MTLLWRKCLTFLTILACQAEEYWYETFTLPKWIQSFRDEPDFNHHISRQCCHPKRYHAFGEITVTPVTQPLKHSEGPHWDEEKGVLFYVDIAQHFVNRFDPATGEYTRVEIPGEGGVSLVIPVKGTEDKFITSSGRDLILLTWDGKNQTDSPEIEVVTSVEPDKTGNRFNDGKADSTGRVWAGTMGPEPVVGEVVPNQGDFFSIDSDSHTAELHIENVTVSNGIAWTADNKIMYYIDSPTVQIVAYDFDVDTAEINNKRTVFDFNAHNLTGVPDGMTIDSDDNLIIACFNGGHIIHVDPRSGELMHVVDLPATRVTSAMFGGPDLDIIYVTTSSFGLTDEELEQQPLAGSVFALEGHGLKASGPAFKAVRTDVFY